MSAPTALFAHEYFPNGRDIPFGDYLSRLFFQPRDDNLDFVIHGPNVVRLTRALVNDSLEGEPGLLAGTKDEKRQTCFAYRHNIERIHDALGIDSKDETLRRTELFISIAAMFHDIGKTIRKANHPQIGANLLRNLDQEQSNLLIKALQYEGESDEVESKYHRFALICSTTQHHDKFGVVSTGEGALPIFSDILYFTSNENTVKGIVKNVTSVMLLNLGDIAAVVPGTMKRENQAAAVKIARQITGRYQKTTRQKDLLPQLIEIIKEPSCCLGLERGKVDNVISDWTVLVESIEDPEIKGSRARLKRRLLYLEQNPGRTIHRIRRLLMASAESCNAQRLTTLLSPALVESVLVGALGSHQFQYFCQQFASAAKLDYSLNFFKAIVCACTRKALYKTSANPEPNVSWRSLSEREVEMLATLDRHDLQSIVNHVTSLFVKVLNGIITRYASVLDSGGLDARRFGFQMRDLTSDDKIREAIIDLLCIQESKDHVALTWIADEVTIWSLD